MKPRSKEQELIVKWTNQNVGPTPKQVAYAKRHCFDDEILESRGRCLCTACKHIFHTKDIEASKLVCPHCGKVLDVTHHKQKITRYNYYSVLTTKANMQMVVWYLVKRVVSKSEDDFTFAHVGTEWINAKGTRFSVELSRFTMCWRKDQWIYGVPMELKRNSVFARYLTSSATYYGRVLPILKRNGWKPNHQFDGYDTEVMRNLMNNQYFESWFKIGHYGVCWDWLQRESNHINWYAEKPSVTDNELVMIKLANRKHIKFTTKDMWKDYLDYMKDLVYMQQDIHNPQILFPDNFQTVHQYWSIKAQKKQNREQAIRQREQDIECMKAQAEKDKQKQAWIAMYTKCFGDMLLCNGEYIIKPLIYMDDFQAEAAHMHHCIVRYYGKVNTLLLSIEHNGKKCETAEISLTGTGNIIQCRGVNNQSSDYHDDIVKVLKGFMNEFIKRFRKATNPQPVVTLPVPISYYHPFKMAI